MDSDNRAKEITTARLFHQSFPEHPKPHWHVGYLSVNDEPRRRQHLLSGPLLSEGDAQNFIATVSKAGLQFPADVDWTNGRPMPIQCDRAACYVQLAERMAQRSHRVVLIWSGLAISIFLLAWWIVSAARGS